MGTALFIAIAGFAIFAGIFTGAVFALALAQPTPPYVGWPRRRDPVDAEEIRRRAAAMVAEVCAQPAPARAGLKVAPDLLALLDAAGHADAAALVRERAAVGLARYGQPLMTEDGRDTMRDAVEELGDLLMYAHSARMQGLDLAPLRDLLPALMEVTK